MSLPILDLRTVGRVVLGVACLLIVATSAGAEVGIVWPSGGQAPVVYIFGTIVDDSDPILTNWRRYNLDGPGRRVLNDQGLANGDGRPTVTRHPFTGEPIVSWAKLNPGGFDVVVSRFTGQDWSLPQVIAGGVTDELDPWISVDPLDGSVHLVYCVDGVTPTVVHREASADLSTWGPEQQVSFPGEAAMHPSIAFHDGALHVAYEVHDSGINVAPKRIEVAVLTAGGIERDTLAYSLHPDANHPEIHSAGGRVWVDWIDGDGQMGWTREVIGTAWEPVQTEPFDGAEELEFHVRGAIKDQAVE